MLHATWPPNVGPNYMPTWSRAAHLDIDVDEPVKTVNLEGEYIAVPLSDSLVIWHWYANKWATISCTPDQVRKTFAIQIDLYLS